MKKWNYLVEPMDFVTESMDALDRFRPQSFEPPTKKVSNTFVLHCWSIKQKSETDAFDFIDSDEGSFDDADEEVQVHEETKDGELTRL